MCGFDFHYSHEVLVHCGMSYTNESPVAGSSRSLNRNISSPTTSTHTDDPTFWVPSTSGAVGGHCNNDTASGIDLFSLFVKLTLKNIRNKNNYYFRIDSEAPQSPTSPTSSNRSFALSVNSNSIPIVRSDKHVVLTTTSPARFGKVVSMQTKLDHTKIDTSLYQQVTFFFFLFLYFYFLSNVCSLFCIRIQ